MAEERWIGLHDLKPAKGSKHRRKRVGRGEGSGSGKTAGRGHKGAGARSGAKDRSGFEGGQNPIHMRMRKLRGPHMKKSMPFEKFRTQTQPVNVRDLESRFEKGAEVTPAGMLALYRIGAYIPAPGINVDAVENISDQFTGSNVLGFLNLFSGGSLQRFAIFALGIMPYITASIILQLMQVVVPSLEKLRKEGEVGQQKITQYTRYLTVGLAFGQSIGYVFLFRSFGASAGASVVQDFTFAKVFVIVTTLTAGTVLVMWLGELITQRGIGNGISLMIFASIVAGLPQG